MAQRACTRWTQDIVSYIVDLCSYADREVSLLSFSPTANLSTHLKQVSYETVKLYINYT